MRVKLVNDTMMAHPIHLHGHFFELVNGAGMMDQPLKHTVVVQPGSIATFDVTANEPGDWAFHCHLLYHMHAGMMQTVTMKVIFRTSNAFCFLYSAYDRPQKKYITAALTRETPNPVRNR